MPKRPAARVTIQYLIKEDSSDVEIALLVQVNPETIPLNSSIQRQLRSSKVKTITNNQA